MVKIEQSSTQSFNNEIGFKHFTNYLCRSDVKQKWTNEMTKYNIVFLMAEENNSKLGEIITDNEYLSKRKSYGKMITDIVSEKKFSRTLLLNEIFYIENIPFKSKIEALNFFKSLIAEIKKKYPDEFDVCYVAHLDQPHLHLHRVFYVKRGKRR